MLSLSAQTYGQEEIDAAMAVLHHGRVTMGEEVAAFEREFAAYLGVDHAIMVNSGSSANLLMIAAAVADGTLREGDTIFAPALTWSTTIWPLLRYGLRVILIDCDEHLQMDAAALASAAAATPSARAIIVAHILGNPADMDAIRAICVQHNLALFEDSCETLGSEYKGAKTGHFGEAASFSFYFSHHITTMEGGMMATNDAALADYARAIRSHGWSRALSADRRRNVEGHNKHIDPRFLFVTEGYNLRPTEIAAAMGRCQLRKLDTFNKAREELYFSMRTGLARYDALRGIAPTPQSRPYWFAFPVLCTHQRGALMAHLEQRGIQTRPIIAGNLAQHPAFRGRVEAGALPNADRVAATGFYWGLHPLITHREIQHLDESLATFKWSVLSS